MSSEIVQSTQPTDEPGPNKFAELLEKLQRLQHRCEQSSLRADNAQLLDDIKSDVRRILQQAQAWDGGDDSTKPNNWQQQLIRLLATNSLKAVLQCLIVDSLRPSPMDRYYPRNADTEYQRQYRTYNQVFGDHLPPSLHQIRWDTAREEYNDERGATANDDWDFYSQYLVRRQQRTFAQIGIPTGIPQLDDALGGLNGLTIVGGPTGVGKTCLAINTMASCLRSDTELCGLYCSLDMPRAVPS
jgi:hypothetical protein